MSWEALIRSSSQPRAALRKMAVAVAGFSVLAVGVALIFLPGPGVVVIPIGLAILAREFPWARKLLLWLKNLVRPLLAGILKLLSRAPWSSGRRAINRGAAQCAAHVPEQA